MIKVMVFGTFDLIHPGHIHMLKEAKKYGDYLVVVVARDNTVLEVKNHLPRLNENQRLENIKKMSIADKALLGSVDDRYLQIIEEKPDIIALGYDQKAFVEKLQKIISKNTKIVRLSPYMPDIYKSSKLQV